MSSQVRKTYDTDVITLRRIFAVNPTSNTPISSGQILATGQNGESFFVNPFQVSSIAALQIGLSTISTTAGAGGGGQPALTSTVVGLGTAGYISSSQFLSSFQGLSNIAVTKINAGAGITVSNNGIGQLTITNSASGGVGVTTDQLFSTVAGLGEIGYVSTPSLQGLISTANLIGLISTANLLNLVSTNNLTGIVSTANLLNLVSTSFLQTSLVSTVTGLSNVAVTKIIAGTGIEVNSGGIGEVTITNTGGGGGGGITNTQLISTVTGLGTIGYVSTPSLLGLISTANLSGLVSTNNLIDLISTANLSGLVSTNNLVDLVSTANLSKLVSTNNLINLVSTANLSGLVSTNNLINLVSTANLSGLVSTNNLINLVSTANLSGLVSTNNLINLVSTANLLNLISTGNLSYLTTGYISSGTISLSTVILLDPYTGSENILTVSSGGLLLNGAGISGGGGSAGVSQIIAGTNISISPGAGTGIVTINGASLTNLVSTNNLMNLISSANLQGFISTANLIDLVSTNNLIDLVSTANLIGLVSTNNLTDLVSTANLVDLVSTNNLIDLVSTANLIGLVSTNNLTDLVSTANLVDLVSTNNLIDLVSTANLFGLISTNNLTDLVSTANLIDLVSTNNLIDLVSTANLIGLVSTANLAALNILIQSSFYSTVGGLGTAGYVSTSGLVSTVIGLGNVGYISTGGLVSTVAGLGNAGYLSTTLSTTTYSTLYTNQLITSTFWLANKSRGPFSGGGAQDTNYLLQVSDAVLYYRATTLPIPATNPGSQVITQFNLQSTITGLSNIAVTKLTGGTDISVTNNGVGNVTINYTGSGGGGGITSIDYISATSISSIFTSSGQFFADYASSVITNATRFNFSSLFVNNTPILFDINGNLQVTYQNL